MIAPCFYFLLMQPLRALRNTITDYLIYFVRKNNQTASRRPKTEVFGAVLRCKLANISRHAQLLATNIPHDAPFCSTSQRDASFTLRGSILTPSFRGSP